MLLLQRANFSVRTTYDIVILAKLYEWFATIIYSFWNHTYLIKNRDSAVGIATRYGLDGPGIESRWGEIFRNSPDRP